MRSENRRWGRGPNDLLHNLDRLCYAAVFEEQGLFLHFWSGVGYGPCGAVGDKRVESSGFRSKRRKTEVSTPLLYNRAERVCKAGGLFQLTFFHLSDDSQLRIFFAVRYH